jgi:hypothetical protein
MTHGRSETKLDGIHLHVRQGKHQAHRWAGAREMIVQIRYETRKSRIEFHSGRQDKRIEFHRMQTEHAAGALERRFVGVCGLKNVSARVRSLRSIGLGCYKIGSQFMDQALGFAFLDRYAAKRIA